MSAPTSSEQGAVRAGRTSEASGSPVPPPPRTHTRTLRARVLEAFVDPSPILLKDLRATLRTALYVRFLYLSTGIVALFVVSAGAAFAADDLPPAEVGRVIFHVFFSALTLVLSFVAPTYAATAITGEKRAGTFESLILTGMSPARIVVGKFLACGAAVLLVVVAVSPVVAVAFLFGGVSPWAVATAFGWVLGGLALATAFGLAVSARLESTWVAIAVAFAVAWASMFVVWPMVTALGEIAQGAWGVPEGPFWFAEALPLRAHTWQGWALLVITPLVSMGMATWYFLASAIASVQPAADDRSTHLKIWSVFAVLGVAMLSGFAVAAPATTREQGNVGVVLAMLSGFVVLALALTLADEPPLAPRLQPEPSLLARLLAPIGPGAGPTLRFTLLLVALASGIVPAVASSVRWALAPATAEHARFDLALLVLAAGHACIGAFCAALTAWLRLVLRNGLAARIVTLAVLGAAFVVPMLGTLIMAPSALDRLDLEIPPWFSFSPVLPALVAGGLTLGDRHRLPEHEAWRVLLPVLGYGLLALALWIAVEVRCVQARRRHAERRRRLMQRSAELGASPAPAGAACRALGPAEPGPAEPSPAASSPAEPRPAAPGLAASGAQEPGTQASGPQEPGPQEPGAEDTSSG